MRASEIAKSATVLARCSVFGPMLLYYIRTYQLDSNSIRSFFEVLILDSEGPPSFSVANLANPLQTVANRCYRHPIRCKPLLPRLYGTVRHPATGSSP